MTDIFDEVEEDVRRDQLARIWRRYGHFILAGALIAILAVGGLIFWRNYQLQRAEADGARFAAAVRLVQAGKLSEAADTFGALGSEAGSGYRALAVLQAGAAKAKNKDIAGAIAAYDQLANDSGADRSLRDLASLLIVLLQLDTVPAEALDQRLAPLLGDDNPWHYTAREISAAVRLKAGDVTAAKDKFRQLADDATAPAGIRGRAAEMLAALGGAT